MPEKSLPSQPIEPLYECPVCLGLPMAKLKLDAHNGRLVLDCCQRCGGIWFDAGEAKAFQQIEPTETQKLFELPSRVPLMQCHACHASMARSVAACPECYWPNELTCPTCQNTLQKKAHGQFLLDICPHCRGVWFDQVDLSALWKNSLDTNVNIETLQKRLAEQNRPYRVSSEANQHPQPAPLIAPGDVTAPLKIPLQEHLYVNNQPIQSNQTSTVPGIAEEIVGEGLANVAVEAIANSPATVEVTTEVAASTIEVLSESLGIGEVVIEVTGKVAAAVVETLVEIVAGLFSS